jgi:Transposase DDE domain
LRGLIEGVGDDGRQRPRIALEIILSTGLVMTLGRLGSLNAMEQVKNKSYWHKWVGGVLPSADTMGRGFSKMGNRKLRRMIKHIYSRLKRNKVLRPAHGDKFALIIDGHEQHCSRLRCCPGCLERRIHTNKGDVKEFYHRCVMASLLCKDLCLPLDMEPQLPGEDEVACAVRLLERIFKEYPRAFELILADGLYARAAFFKLAVQHGKDVIAVLKDDRRDLLKDARGLFKGQRPKIYSYGPLTRECWDIEHFTSWHSLDCETRVVRSIERREIRRQMSGKIHFEVSEWIWVSTISRAELATEDFVKFGHDRWKIENNGFNELVNEWHADHLYRHDPAALENFWLVTMLAYILFHAFIGRNLKSVFRSKHTKRHLAEMITAEIYQHAVPALVPS